MRTRQSFSDLIESRLWSPDGRAELVLLATRLIVEEALEAESRDAVGRAYYEHGAAPGQGYCNGVRTGRLKTAEGLIEYAAPQIAGRDEPFRLEIRDHLKGRTQALEDLAVELLSDNGSSYISSDPAEWLDDRSMEHVRGAPYHPQTQGKIERWHQTLKNKILPEIYYLPGDLETKVGAFAEHYNHQRYHESLNNLTPADVYFWRGQSILLARERIKRQTVEHRRLQHRKRAA